MDFCEFAKIAWPLVTTGEKRQGDKVRDLLLSITHFKNEEDDFISPANVDTLSRYFSVPGRISETARKMIPYLDPSGFIELADQAEPDVKRNVAARLKPMLPDVEAGNVSEKAAELFVSIIRGLNVGDTNQTVQNALLLENDHTQDNGVAVLLEECSWRCPICNARLIKRSRDTALKRYRKVAIVPSQLRPQLCARADELKISVPKFDSLDNMGVLCSDHADDYEMSPSIEKCVELLKTKAEMKARYELVADIDELDIEDAITGLLDSLNELVAASEDMPSRMDPVEVSRKIRPENAMLKRTVEAQVIDYFYLMKSEIDRMTEDKSISFRKLSSNMRLCYENFSERGYSQDKTFGMMANWVSECTGCENLIACEVFVSFFVQMCEVFDEIAE